VISFLAMDGSKKQVLIELARKSRILRAGDLRGLNIPREYLHQLYRQGVLNRIAHGTYQIADADITEHHSLAEAIKRVSRGVICLLSALSFHNLTTQLPFEVWIAIDRKAHKPKTDGVALRVFRFSGEALTSGIEEHVIEGVTIKVYNPAKTVADCFKYRNKIGIDVAIEALRETRRERKATMDEIYRYARICHVDRVMRPYMEAIA
jgi:predicted transcriptional regulator of viral defense system